MPRQVESDQQWLESLEEQVSGLRYGTVTITVHDGRVVQIDRTEKTRFDNASQKKND